MKLNGCRFSTSHSHQKCVWKRVLTVRREDEWFREEAGVNDDLYTHTGVHVRRILEAGSHDHTQVILR